MDKSELLLRMVENPEQYSDEQIQELLTDEECRELYEAMRLSADAFELEDAKAKIAAGLKDEEWQKFESSQAISQKSESQEISASSLPAGKGKNGVFFKIAAMFIGLLVLSGIAYAAYQIANCSGEASQKPAEETQIANPNQQTLAEELSDSIQLQPIVFENAELQTMLSEIATYYNYKVSFRNEAAKHVRLYFTWNKTSKIEDVVAMFNKFERIHIVIENQTLIVE